MGWWMSENNLLLGDGPADILGTAYEAIMYAYETHVGRKPRRAELRALIEFTLPPFLTYELDQD